jgi:hypothetical protein
VEAAGEEGEEADDAATVAFAPFQFEFVVVVVVVVEEWVEGEDPRTRSKEGHRRRL